jgi:beta-mannosidase
VARAYAPLLVAARFASLSWADQPEFEADLWCASSYIERLNANLHAQIIGPTGEVYIALEQPVTLAGNAITLAEPLCCALKDVAGIFFLDLLLTDDNETVLAANRYLFTRESNLGTALDWPAAQIAVDVKREPHRWQIAVSNPGTVAALYLWLEDARQRRTEGYIYFSDNHFCLLPGETHRILVAWNGVPLDERQITISGWNIAAMTL